MPRRVRGSLFVDYVRMIRARKGGDFARWLLPGDRAFLAERIEPTAWYPMETFERMGLAILNEVAADQITLVELFGRGSVDGLIALHPMLLAKGDPRETLMRFQALQRGFFDFPVFDMQELTDGSAALRIDYQMSARAEEAACHQSLGFFDRLIEVAGATDHAVQFTSRRWAGEPTTMLAMTWR